MMYGAELSMFYSLLQVFIIAVYALIYFTFIFPLLFVAAFYIYGEVKATIRETSRIDKMSKSPIVSFLQESISGTSTIRAFGYSEKFIQK